MIYSKTLYLIIALIIGIIVLFVIKLSVPSPNTSQNPPGEVIQFSPPPNLKILTTTLSSEPINVTEGFIVKFDKPVNKSSLVLTIVPQTEVIISLDAGGTELIVEPADAWMYDRFYTVTIFRSTLSEDGELLDKDYQFNFKAKPFIGI